MLDGDSSQDRRLHLVLGSIGLSHKMVFVKLIKKQGLSPEVFKEEEFIKLEVIQHEKIENIGRVAFFKHGPHFDSEDVI